MSAPLEGRRDQVRPQEGSGLDWLPGGWFTLSAFAAALIVCVTAAIFYYLNPSAAEDELAAPPTVSASAGPTTGRPADPNPVVDVEEFREFAMGDRPFPPEWLVRVKKVYWTDAGELRANTQMPSIPRERAFTIKNICEALSDYVTTNAGRPFQGVSVRDLDGDEVLTRARPTDSCTPGE